MKSQSTSVVGISQLAISDFKKIELLSIHEKYEVLSLLKTSYPHYGYHQISDNYPCYQNLYIYRMRINKTLVASRQFLIVDDLSKSPIWAIEMGDALHTNRYAIGSRAIVHPFLRGHGLGSKLIETVNQELYLKHGIDTIFGSSTSITAIKLYLKYGAKLWGNDLERFRPANNIHATHKSTNKILNLNHIVNTRISLPIRYFYQNIPLSTNKNENQDYSFNQLNVHAVNNTLLSA